jgi:hypothetical protein
MGLVDDERWPLVIVTWPTGALQNEDVETAMRTLATYYGRRHAVLFDGMQLTGLSGEQRRRMLQHAQWYEDEVRQWVVASAAVIESSLWRGVIRVIQQLAPPPVPFRTFGSRMQGEEWLLLALRRAGLWRPTTTHPPPNLAG